MDSTSTLASSGSEDEADLKRGLEKIVSLLGENHEDLLGALENGVDESIDSDEDEEAFSGFAEDASDSDSDENVMQTLDEDAEGVDGPATKIAANNAEALERVLAGFKTDASFFETQTLTYTEDLVIPDASNDLERELEFYKQSLWAANHARKLFLTANKPFHRPNDFFAEMVKSDEHMERVRQRLLDESASIKASEEARRQRDLKKFGKKVQVAKQQERDRARKQLGERVKEFKKKRKEAGPSMGGGGDDDFDIELDEEPAAKRPRQSNGSGPKMSRHRRDAKYGHPRQSKSNDRKSTDDVFSGAGKRGGHGNRGGRGGRGGRAGASGRGRPTKTQRPGKNKRASTRQ